MTVAMYSGGVCSHLAAKRAQAKYGNVHLLISDTGREDQDLWRFVAEGAAFLKCPLTVARSGESFEQMIVRHHALPSNMMAFCSGDLKTAPAIAWVKAQPHVERVILGMDWTEMHRCRENWHGFPVEYPMIEAPYLTKQQMFAEVEADGIAIPRLYRMGFQHNNCGGGCVRNGQSAWRHLLRTMPERYAEWEQLESLIPGATFCKREVKGEGVPYSLPQIRQDSVERSRNQPEIDWGGCGCFTEVQP